MHLVKAKGLVNDRGGMNIYRGCQHGCIYCDARSRCYQMNHVFEDIEVKENALELLEDTLKRRRRPGMIGTGVMSDPYMPLEASLEMTRKALLLIEKYGFGATVLTKSDLVLRDLDVLQRIHRNAKTVVQMSLTNCDERLERILEPNVCSTRRRYGALKEFQAHGIPTVVWICPIIPYLNDTQENIRFLVECCADAGVKGIIQFGMGLTLRDGNREYFYRKLDAHFPGLKEEYIRHYGNAYELPSPREPELSKLFRSLCDRYGIWHDNDRAFGYLATLEDRSPRQLSFF